MNIVDIIIEANQNKRSNLAIQDIQGGMNYGDLMHEVENLSLQLVDFGLQRGMGVGVMGKNSRQFIISVLSLLKLEVIVMPISNQLKSHEINQILERAHLHFLLSDENSPETGTTRMEQFTVSEKTWTLSSYAQFDGKYFASHIPDAAIVRYTSGTTGRSKGVIISHRSINERLDAANKCLQLNDSDVVIWVLQMAYHFVVSILLYLKYGCTIVICKNFVADMIYNDVINFNGTFLYASPLHIRLLTNYSNGENMPTLNRVISTSTAISRLQCEAFQKKYNLPVTQAYGIIEIGLPIINYDRSSEDPDSVGRVLEDYEVEVLGEQNGVLPRESIGHLAIKGPGMFDGYLAPAKSRNELLNKGWFMTGDLASISPDGIIKIEGRKKSMINVAGNKVFPLEVEQVLDTHPQIIRSRASGFQHRILGEMVQAEIIIEPNQIIDHEEVLSYCRKRLSTHKIPQKLIVVDNLAMTDSGKLVRSV